MTEVIKKRILAITGGNIGALNLLATCFQQGGEETLAKLEATKLSGRYLYLCWSDICKKDLTVFLQKLEEAEAMKAEIYQLPEVIWEMSQKK